MAGHGQQGKEVLWISRWVRAMIVADWQIDFHCTSVIISPFSSRMAHRMGAGTHCQWRHQHQGHPCSCPRSRAPHADSSWGEQAVEVGERGRCGDGLTPPVISQGANSLGRCRSRKKEKRREEKRRDEREVNKKPTSLPVCLSACADKWCQ
jgi:hypothetical protein